MNVRLFAVASVAIACMLLGCSPQQTAVKPGPMPVMEVAEAAEHVETITPDEFIGKAREAWESLMVQPEEEEAEEEEEWAEEYYEPVYYSYADYSGYSGGFEATDTADLLGWQGNAHGEDGTEYTWYYHDIGNGPLDIPGETFDEDGVSHDGDGYIAVASSDYERGTVIDTPYGEAKVYDYCPVSGVVDIYTNR